DLGVKANGRERHGWGALLQERSMLKTLGTTLGTTLGAALGAALILGAATTATAAGAISGAGATFPAPVYNKWAEAYKAQTGAVLNYQPIGSGGGIKQIEASTVDFG